MSAPSRQIAVVHFPQLALMCCPAGHRAGVGVVVDEEKPSPSAPPFVVRGVLRLAAVAPDLRSQGVQAGMRIIDAQRYAPALSVQVVRRSAMTAELQAVTELLLAFTPLVEPMTSSSSSSSSSVALDLTGITSSTEILTAVETLLASLGHEVVVAMSPGKRLSLALARDMAQRPERYGRRRRLVVAVSQVSRAIAHLDVGALGLEPEIVEGLRALGVHQGQTLRTLVPAGASARLLAAARPVLRLLSGEDHEPLKAWRPPERIEERFVVDDAIDLLEPLLFVLKTPCERLCRRVVARSAKVAEVRLTLQGRDLTPFSLSLAFPDPVSLPAVLLQALGVRLGVTGVPGPVEVLTLCAVRMAEGRARQSDAFFVDDAPPEVLSALLVELEDAEAGCLVHEPAMLPEQMTSLCWPPPKHTKKSKHASSSLLGSSSALSSASASASASQLPSEGKRLEALADGGRFMAGWPWPVRVLRDPIYVEEEEVAVYTPFARVAGVDDRHRPYARTYSLVELMDGRRALGVQVPGEGLMVQGWFD